MKLSKPVIVAIIIGAIVLILGFNGCSTYNNLVTMSEGVDNAWAKVENQYQRRFDLIPNLMRTVKGYAKHESETFTKVTEARAGLTSALDKAQSLKNGDMTDENAFNQYTQAQANLNKQLGLYINAVHEAYPELKANENFQDLQSQLEGTENRIATERGRYTDEVKTYNVAVRRFPASIWAGMFGFRAKPQYQADAEAQSAPKVSFDDID